IIKKYMKNIIVIIYLVVVDRILIQASNKNKVALLQTDQQENSTSSEQKKVVGSYEIKALPLPENLDFAGEKVPLQDPDIRRRMDRELLVNTYWQSNMLILLKRANQYFPIIEPILKEHEVQEDYKYLAVAEDGLDQVVSP